MRPAVRGLALAAAVVAAFAAYWLARRATGPPSDRLAIEAEGPCAAGLAILLGDLAETQNRWIVLPPGAAPAGATTLRLRTRHEGGGMAVTGTLDGRPLPPQEGAPPTVLAGLAAQLGLDPPGPKLMPTDPQRAWDLLDLSGRSQDESDAALTARAEALVRAEPGCTSARLAYLNLLTRYLVEHPAADTLDAQDACERDFREGIRELPAYPRLTGLFAIHLTDIGRQREALQLLQEALRRHPGSLPLHNGLAYAARTAGLLDLADRALARQSQLAGRARGQLALADNTLLYTGRTEAFEASVNALPGGPLRAFYGGYARLLQGDREGARACFAVARPGGLGSTLFVRLAGVYRLALEGQAPQALALLDALESERTRIHLPDGEFTFKVAEAYGFLGEPGKALDVAERASVQGFGCADWFERTPFLEEARKLPKWRSLDQHLREREQLLAGAFPPSAFGL